MHVEFLVEDSSSDAMVEVLLGRLLSAAPHGEDHSWRIHPFGGKQKMLERIPKVLGGIRAAQFADGIVVLLDADRDDCVDLKQSLMDMASSLGYQAEPREVWIRIAVTELESWFIGDPAATRAAYPRITEGDLRLRQWRDPDSVPNAWEWLEKLLIRRGHYVTRMPKTIVARNIAEHLNLEPDHNTSVSFCLFLRTIREVYDLPPETPGGLPGLPEEGGLGLSASLIGPNSP